MEVTIKEITYKVKYSIRAMFIFEQLTGNTFRLEKLMDWYIFYYSMILANNPESTLTFEGFIEECDVKPTLVMDLHKYIADVLTQQAQLSKEDNSKKKQ